MKNKKPSHIVEKAAGAYLYLKDGRKVFDAISSWWVINHGHCEPEIVEAIQKTSAKMDQVIFSNFDHDPANELIEELSDFLPEHLEHYFFSDNGSTSVEVALKMSLQSHLQSEGAKSPSVKRSKKGNNKRNNKRNKVIAFEHSYHGDTVGCMSVTGDSVFTEPYKKMLFPVLRAKHPRFSENHEDFIEDFKKLVSENADELATVIIEPLVQGAGGMIVWPVEAIKEVVEISKKAGAHVVFDEVMTGFGRTGSLFAFEKIGVIPDIICLSKGLTGGVLPLSLTVVTNEIFQSFYFDEKAKMFFHGHSFTANPIACSAATASLKLFKKRNYKKIWSDIENVHIRNKENLVSRFSINSSPKKSPIKDIRICGTIAAVELNSDKAGYSSDSLNSLSEKFLEKEIFVRPLGNVFYLLPPFCSETESLDACWQTFGEWLEVHA